MIQRRRRRTLESIRQIRVIGRIGAIRNAADPAQPDAWRAMTPTGPEFLTRSVSGREQVGPITGLFIEESVLILVCARGRSPVPGIAGHLRETTQRIANTSYSV